MATASKKPVKPALPETKQQATPAFADAPIKGSGRALHFMLQVGLITLPVRVNTGARPASVRFHRLHSTCRSQLQNAEEKGGAYCPNCEEHIKADEVVRGYEVVKGNFVILSEEEIAGCKPDTDRLIVIDSFVPARDIDPIYFESSYYLTPEDNAGSRAFVLIRDVLSDAGRVGIGKATLYGNEHTVILRSFGTGLALHRCFLQNELNMISFGVGGTEITAKELEMAHTLVNQMEGAFEPGTYVDRYAANVKDLVAAKQAGIAPSPAIKQKRAVVIDLMSALAQSVEAAKKRRTA